MYKIKSAECGIIPVHYSPPPTYRLDLEIFPFSDLRRRVSADFLRNPEQIKFHLLVYITKNQCVHTVDSESIDCRQGSLLILHPGQVHLFDTTADWQGWVVIFRPEFLQPITATPLVTELEVFCQLEELPMHLSLNENQQSVVEESIVRMFHDAQLQANTHTLDMLLRNQLHALLNRIHLIVTSYQQDERLGTVLLQRFKRYRLAVEQDFHRLHRVTDYATYLGYSEKSLCRAVLAFTGLSAKAFLSKRILLEAKRLLIHTGSPVSMIANKLGYDEATNFIKFFRREAGCSPGDFRRRHAVR